MIDIEKMLPDPKEMFKPRNIVRFVVKSSVKFVVTSAVKTLVRPETKTEAVKAYAGGYLISTVVADHCAEYVDRQIDDMFASEDTSDVAEETTPEIEIAVPTT